MSDRSVPPRSAFSPLPTPAGSAATFASASRSMPPLGAPPGGDAYADLLRSQGVRQNDFVHKMKIKIRELGCARNYGQWRSHCNRKRVECQKRKVECQKKKVECKKKTSCKKPSSNKCKR